MIRTSRIYLFLAAGLFLLNRGDLALAVGPAGLAAMGASETEGTTYDGSWVPYLANYRGLNFGPGQSYNVAIGGSDSTDLLNEGQHTEVAALVAAGKVDTAFLTVGGLDFPPVVPQILAGTLDVPTFINKVTGNITTAVDTVLTAGQDRMIVLSVPDMTLTGGGQRTLTTPALQQPVISVIDQLNAQLKTDILGRGQVYVDFAGIMRSWTAHPLVVGGVTIDTKHESSSPDHLWLNDLHVAVVGNALFANLMLSAINKEFGTNYPLFTDQLILQQAGLSASYTGETSNLDYASFIYVPTPEPATWVMAAAMCVTLAAFRFRRFRDES